MSAVELDSHRRVLPANFSHLICLMFTYVILKKKSIHKFDDDFRLLLFRWGSFALVTMVYKVPQKEVCVLHGLFETAASIFF